MKYHCNTCDMSVCDMKCGQCHTEMVHDNVDLDGERVAVCRCPKGCGMIKPPQCCGEEMKPD